MGTASGITIVAGNFFYFRPGCSSAMGPAVGIRASFDQEISVSLHLYDHVTDLLRTVEKKLVGCFRRDPDHVSGGNPLANASLNPATALFMGCDSLGVDQRAAHNESCRAGAHKNDIRLRFMPLR